MQEQNNIKDLIDEDYEFDDNEKHIIINQFTGFLYKLRKNNIKVSGPTKQDIINFAKFLEYLDSIKK